MNKTEVAALARKLMNENELGHVPFQFSRTKRAIARCHYKYGKASLIEMSELFLPVLSDERIEVIIKHEIAHALVGHAAGHGRVWKWQARQLGIKGDRCETLTPEEKRAFGERNANYRATCKSERCNNVVYFHRMGKAWQRGTNVCGKCRSPLKVETIR